MATFAQIYKQELKSKGILSSLGSAAFKRTKERLDPRNMLFGGEGVLASTGQKIFGKGYQAVKKGSSAEKISEGRSGGVQLQSEALNSLLASSERQESHLKQVGRNTMPLRSMARDMNVMRQNMIKLLKVWGGKPTNRADMFFKSQKEEESAYENRVGATRVSERADIMKKPEKKEDGGIFSSIMKMLPMLAGIGLAIKSALSGPMKMISGLIDAISPITSLVKNGIDIALKVGGKAVGLAAAGARGLISIIRSAAPLLLGNPAILALLSAGAIAWLVNDYFKQKEEFEDLEKKAEAGTITQKESERYNQLYQNREMANMPDPEAYGVLEAQKENEIAKAASARSKFAQTDVRRIDKNDTAPKKLGFGQVEGLPIDYNQYKETIGKRESGGRYDAVNKLGFIGKYQFGAAALEDLGLIKPGSWKKYKSNSLLDDPSNWVYSSKEDFLKNPKLQEEMMLKYTQMNMRKLKKMGVVNNSMSEKDVAGYLASAHLVGPGGARALSLKSDRADAFGTKASEYFALGQQSQKGQALSTASNAGADLRLQMNGASTSQPVVVAPATNVQNNQSVNLRPTVSNTGWTSELETPYG